jgi:hypothetical protein
MIGRVEQVEMEGAKQTSVSVSSLRFEVGPLRFVMMAGRFLFIVAMAKQIMRFFRG